MVPTLAERLRCITGDIEAFKKLVSIAIPGKTAAYTADLVLFGAFARAMSACAGFRTLIESRNFACSAAILRMQLDTAMRLNGASLVDDRSAYVDAVFRGERVHRLKDRDRKKLTDAYLAQRLSERHPWVAKVYSRSSELVHFTNRQIFIASGPIGDQGNVDFFLGDKDRGRADSEYFEIVDAFRHSTQLVAELMVEWFVSLRPERQLTLVADDRPISSRTWRVERAER